MKFKYEINPACKINKIALDDGQNFAFVIDDILLNPQEVIDFAVKAAYFDPVGTDKTFYPGVRDAMPVPYGRALRAWVMPIIAKEFFSGDKLNSSDPICKLSLVTVDEKELVEAQKIPHVDSSSEYDFAFVHYFCDKPFGGTSLYRYKPIGSVSVKENHLSVLQEMASSASSSFKDEHAGYMNGDTSLFDRVAKIEAKFNRLVFYKSNLLHSADVSPLVKHPKDVLNGRLTVASFLYFEPFDSDES